jgi:hypothetical protein
MNPWAIVGALVAAILIGAGGFHFGDVYGTNAEKVKNQSAEIVRKDTTINTLTKADKDNKALAEKQAADAKRESQKHENELADVRARAIADAGKRVPIDRAKFCSGDAPGTPKTGTPGGDGQTDAGAAFLPDALTGDLRRLAADADEVAADLRTLKARVDDAKCFAGS